MNTKRDNLIHMRVAARKYGLTVKWLREQAKSGAIPGLVADGQVLFDESILVEYLSELARKGANSESKEAKQ